MKKKSIAICTIIAIVIVAGVWLLLRPKALGNINASSFTAEKGDRVKFSFQSDM